MAPPLGRPVAPALQGLDLRGGHLARALVFFQLEADALALLKAGETRALNDAAAEAIERAAAASAPETAVDDVAGRPS